MDPTKRYCKLQVNKKKKRRIKFVNKQAGTSCEECEPAKFKLDRFIEDVKKYAAKAKKNKEKEQYQAEKRQRNEERSKLHLPEKRGLFENAVLSKTVQSRGCDPVKEGRIHVARLKGDLSSLVTGKSLVEENIPVSIERQESEKKESSTDESFKEAHSKIVERIICGDGIIGNNNIQEHEILSNSKEEIRSRMSSEIIQESFERIDNVLQNFEPPNDTEVHSITGDIRDDQKFKTPEERIINAVDNIRRIPDQNVFDGPSRRDAIEGKTAFRPTIPTQQSLKNVQRDILNDRSYQNNPGNSWEENEKRTSKYSNSAANLLMKYYKQPNFKRPLEDIILHNELCRQHMKNISQKVTKSTDKRDQMSYSHAIKKVARCFVKKWMMESSPPPESSTLGSEITMLFGKNCSNSFRNMLNIVAPWERNQQKDAPQSHSSDIIDVTGVTREINYLQNQVSRHDIFEKNDLMIDDNIGGNKRQENTFPIFLSPKISHVQPPILFNPHATNHIYRVSSINEELKSPIKSPDVKNGLVSPVLHSLFNQPSEMTTDKFSDILHNDFPNNTNHILRNRQRLISPNQIPDTERRNVFITPIIKRRGPYFSNIDCSNDIMDPLRYGTNNVLNDTVSTPPLVPTPRRAIISPPIALRLSITPTKNWPLVNSPYVCDLNPKRKRIFMSKEPFLYSSPLRHEAYKGFALTTPFKILSNSPRMFEKQLFVDDHNPFLLNNRRQIRHNKIKHTEFCLPPNLMFSPVNSGYENGHRYRLSECNNSDIDDFVDSIFLTSEKQMKREVGFNFMSVTATSNKFAPEDMFKFPREPVPRLIDGGKKTKNFRHCSSALASHGFMDAPYHPRRTSHTYSSEEVKKFRNSFPTRNMPLFSPHNF